MRRTNTQPGARFTVRGQRYVQTGSFFHEMRRGRTVRVLELISDCPECGASFDLTASLKQIENRMLVRRCKPCRKIHHGPVDVHRIAKRKMHKKTKGRGRRRQTAAHSPDSRTKYESDLDTYRAALGMLAWAHPPKCDRSANRT